MKQNIVAYLGVPTLLEIVIKAICTVFSDSQRHENGEMVATARIISISWYHSRRDGK